MIYEKKTLYEDREDVTLTSYVHSDSIELLNGKARGAILICPGGGYINCSDLVEQEEGVFDFSLVDGLIEQARQRGKKLGLLWFGSWKNAQCSYAPSWVKTDVHRFKRAEIVKGKAQIKLESLYGISYSTLSYLCEATKEADAKAFRELILHLKEFDEKENTVIMVQVENEVGLLGASRENSDEADAIFASAAPQQFVNYMRSHTSTMSSDMKNAVEHGAASGDWKAVFGDVADEIFSAYYAASYVNQIAAAGKEVYPLPMFVNCWLDKGGESGTYPTGGPVSRVLEVWKYCAPNIDIFAPDIYVPYFCDICDEYTKGGNSLLIPETPTHNYSGPRQVYVVGHHHAIGFSPFGFEDMGKPFSMIDAFLFGVDTSDKALIVPQNVEEYAWYNKTLNSMLLLLTEKYGTPDLQAVCSERRGETTMLFGDYGFMTMMDTPRLSRKDGVCLVLKVAVDEFYVIVNGAIMRPFSTNAKKPNLDILLKEEGQFVDGIWQRSRRLNGDEMIACMYEEPTLLRFKFFVY